MNDYRSLIRGRKIRNAYNIIFDHNEIKKIYQKMKYIDDINLLDEKLIILKKHIKSADDIIEKFVKKIQFYNMLTGSNICYKPICRYLKKVHYSDPCEKNPKECVAQMNISQKKLVGKMNINTKKNFVGKRKRENSEYYDEFEPKKKKRKIYDIRDSIREMLNLAFSVYSPNPDENDIFETISFYHDCEVSTQYIRSIWYTMV